MQLVELHFGMPSSQIINSEHIASVNVYRRPKTVRCGSSEQVRDQNTLQYNESQACAEVPRAIQPNFDFQQKQTSPGKKKTHGRILSQNFKYISSLKLQ
mmetsp:Transcript_85918/g.229201  ORF Transcript_85918/g.229201 Transcript_85918/m.229201 type:complete len:99 (+) Transcript_85918:1070-1366(+)